MVALVAIMQQRVLREVHLLDQGQLAWLLMVVLEHLALKLWAAKVEAVDLVSLVVLEEAVLEQQLEEPPQPILDQVVVVVVVAYQVEETMVAAQVVM
jgi:hypothetical protein